LNTEHNSSSNSQTPELSVCIVSWNTKELLGNCLESVFADPRSERWEVIVVDNASTDGSAEMVEQRFPGATLVASATNLGFARANNVAMERAAGRCFLLLNSDTRVHEGALGGIVALMDEHDDMGAAGPMLLNDDESLQPSCGSSPSLRSETVRKLLLHRLLPSFKRSHESHRDRQNVDWVTGACLFVKRDVVSRVGPLDPEIFMFYEDIEWCLRIRRAGWKIGYHPGFQVIHLGGQSTRKNLEAMLVTSQRSLYYLFQRHFSGLTLQALRGLTVVEMVLRTVMWTGVYLMRPGVREEGGQRLRAYRTILRRTIFDRNYWAPVTRQTTEP